MPGESTVKTTLYPKRYATVIIPESRFDHMWLVARYDDGRDVTLNWLWKSGSSSSLRVKPGSRIKVYQRPSRSHPNWRMVGD